VTIVGQGRFLPQVRMREGGPGENQNDSGRAAEHRHPRRGTINEIEKRPRGSQKQTQEESSRGERDRVQFHVDEEKIRQRGEQNDDGQAHEQSVERFSARLIRPQAEEEAPRPEERWPLQKIARTWPDEENTRRQDRGDNNDSAGQVPGS